MHYSELAKASKVPNQILRFSRFLILTRRIDGQRFDFGDCDTKFSIQTAIRPFIYALALTVHGSEYVHKYSRRSNKR